MLVFESKCLYKFAFSPYQGTEQAEFQSAGRPPAYILMVAAGAGDKATRRVWWLLLWCRGGLQSEGPEPLASLAQ